MSQARTRSGWRIGVAGVVVSLAAVACGTVACGTDDVSPLPGGAAGGGGTGLPSGGGGGGDAGGGGGGPSGPPQVLFEPRGLQPEQVAILVNDQDPVSVALGAYYQQARGIPAEQVITLSFGTDAVLPATEFEPLKDAVDAALPPTVQALALTWTRPFRVACMSITSAFALGFDDRFCNTTGGACGATAPVDYFDSDSSLPFDDHQLRPAMTIAAATIEDGEALIDRGVASDGTFPSGDGYLVRTTDTARSVRWPGFIATVDAWNRPEGLRLTYVDNADGSGSNVVANTDDILFYFTSLANVADIDTNAYLPGAVADHLTSFGGRLPTAGGQMSVLRWLEAGATGSFGTTVEPCNFRQKFPDTEVMLPHYVRGETLIEAYWKSVAWPGEGIFVGEPLARPWGSRAEVEGDVITITTTTIEPDTPYEIVSGPSADGPWDVVVQADIEFPDYGIRELVVTGAEAPFYLLRRAL
ncbi:MAG: TIGR03790 family protein [Myxococcota bacterium]